MSGLRKSIKRWRSLNARQNYLDRISAAWVPIVPMWPQVFVRVLYLMDDLRHRQLVHVWVRLFLHLSIHRPERQQQSTHLAFTQEKSAALRTHYPFVVWDAIIQWWRKAVRKRNGLGGSVGSVCAAEVCVTDISFQGRVSDTRRNLMQMNPPQHRPFPLDKLIKITFHITTRLY